MSLSRLPEYCRTAARISVLRNRFSQPCFIRSIKWNSYPSSFRQLHASVIASAKENTALESFEDETNNDLVDDMLGKAIPIAILKDAEAPIYKSQENYPVWLFHETASDPVSYSAAVVDAPPVPKDMAGALAHPSLQFWNKIQREPPTYFLGSSERRTLQQLRKTDVMDMTHEDMRRHMKLERRALIKADNMERKTK
uniref:Uncharacterized protein n=1 Tax=Corethron hystrix TaxID=216773 RepID=A0A7S1FJW3_9STRA|mmetsp:Transcript_1029/g.2010  ORF Transcript_1029/g.2010 Transcript_1029/m.2010 type:complete len:197 (+) Transcript_1029:82-672(+)